MTDLITTHANADFDALASMVAARKLYPGARLVLPGSQERAVREFMSLCSDLVKIEYEKDASLENVTRLIIVETRLKSRIGKMAQLAGKKGVDVHIYDHHPRTGEDIKADKDIYGKTGASTTILVDLIKDREIKISPLEATIMALGIYEDTGSLSFPTTTREDIDMVSFLVSMGADLHLVSSYLRRELTDKELSLLALLIQSTEVHVINSVHVAIAAITSEQYVDDLSLLAHKLEEAENFNLIFVMVQTRDKVQFIARSGLPFVNVAKIAALFGGGGHPSAAGAVIRDMSLAEVKSKLIEYLRSHIHSDIKARELVTGKPVEMDIDEPVSAAREKLAKALSEYAVVKVNGRLEGIAALKDLDRAVSLGFGHARVKGYMSRKIFPVKPDTSVYAIQDMIQQKEVGCVPVFDGVNLLGLVTRSDILRAFHGRLFAAASGGDLKEEPRVTVNLTPRIKKAFPGKMAELLRLAGRLAEEMEFTAFAVGGFVRDLLLGVTNFDVDIVIEGNAIEYAKKLSKELCGVYVYHKRFGTATVFFPCPAGIAPSKSSGGKFRIDIAMTRTEIYERPAALPTVKFGPIENDLFRRDFTINAMAFRLGRQHFGELLDPFHGRIDLKEGVIRALHDLSFVDDPTRIFRGVRFEQRFDFRIEPHTESLIKKAVGLKMVDRTQKQRIREELIAILSEEKPLKAVKRLSELNELRFIDPGLTLKSKNIELFSAADEALAWYDNMHTGKKHALERWLVYLAVLLDELDPARTKKICGDFVFRKADAAKLISYKKNSEKILAALSKKEKLRPSVVCAHLDGFSHEAMVALMAKTRSQAARRRIASYMTKYALVKLDLRGDDLKKAGIEPGPHFKEIIRKTLRAKLDGKVKTKGEEVAFAVSHFKGDR
ncbi:MAG: CBS domain-containing protein [Candidatus Omnitrophica bacterium]|nr:CBS domain-containing protein [Candidatus Omnitrophota bacterium]MDD5545851.1 CBS domain-containing protein [Candidatus Omnitrophota bacterium]